MENPQNKWRFQAGKIIYKWAIFHGYVNHNQRVIRIHDLLLAPQIHILRGRTFKVHSAWHLGSFCMLRSSHSEEEDLHASNPVGDSSKKTQLSHLLHGMLE